MTLQQRAMSFLSALQNTGVCNRDELYVLIKAMLDARWNEPKQDETAAEPAPRGECYSLSAIHPLIVSEASSTDSSVQRRNY